MRDRARADRGVERVDISKRNCALMLSVKLKALLIDMPVDCDLFEQVHVTGAPDGQAGWDGSDPVVQPPISMFQPRPNGSCPTPLKTRRWGRSVAGTFFTGAVFCEFRKASCSRFFDQV